MAFFVVPMALMAVGGAAGAKGAWDTYQANSTRKEAAARKAEAKEKLDAAVAKTERATERLQVGYGRLRIVRLSALGQLEEVVAWLGRGSVKEAAWGDLPEAEQPDFTAWTKVSVEAKTALSGAVATAAGSAGAKGAAVWAAGAFGKASTGAAIKGLSGVAAKKAGLAWLGGGALAKGGGGVALGFKVLGGLNVGFAALGVGLTARKLAASYDTASRDFTAKAAVEVTNQKAIRRSMHEIDRRMNQLRRAMNPIADHIRELLDTGDPTDETQSQLMVALAMALSRLARYDIADEAGNLAEGWDNPYKELGPLSLEPTDDDFVRVDEEAS